MTRWCMQPGPAVTPLEALARVADAPVIAMLHGTQGACLVWSDTPIAMPAISSPQILHDLGLGGEMLAKHPGLRREALPPDPRFGTTWCDVPPEAWLIQGDYEYPAEPMRLIPAPIIARWDADGICTLLGIDETLVALMAQRLAAPVAELAPLTIRQPWTSAWDADGHAQRVQRIKELIAAGDCYQVNLAVAFRNFCAPAPHRDIAAFQALMRQSPAPYAAFFRTPDRPSVVSHSPECLLAARSDRLVSVPIKGTRRRQAGNEAAQWAELRGASKDAAELAMIVDLVRNDLGRVAVTGSVGVVDQAVRMELPYVIHRAARIEARLRPGLSVADALPALFPAGSITGAPKRRVCEIIAELEGTKRGAYCGTFGWMGPGGADLAVAIRTAEIDGNQIVFHAGGGIVWDSDPAAEWDEVRAKASGMAVALGGEL